MKRTYNGKPHVESVYPFSQLEVKQSFFVPANCKRVEEDPGAVDLRH
jgi:hypothetical protein